MHDEFMLTGLRKPRPELVRRVRARLGELEARERRAARLPLLRWATAAAAVVVLAFALALPSVRAAAQAFLDLFRVVNFAPVSVGTERLKLLADSRGIDLRRLLGDQTQVMQAPGPAQVAPTLEAAGSLAGMRIAVPAWRPVGLELQRIEVVGSESLRIAASTATLQSVLDSLGIDDVSAPAWLNGKVVTANVAPIVKITYSDAGRSDAGRRAVLIESRQPQVVLPQGADLAQLADIALRVLGVERKEAYRVAQSIDWRTTLIVPVPADVSYFREVDVQGRGGLLIGTAPASGRQARRSGAQLLWSSGDRVFALIGNLHPEELFAMAQSMQ